MSDIFGGLPIWVQVLFWAVLAITVSSLVSVVSLLVLARRFRNRVRGDVQRDPGGSVEQNFLWVFLVPALNEEVTIADSVARLRRVAATHAMFLVIDDGSEDRTGEILAGIDDPRLNVLTRTAPHAREGKAAALNAAYAHVRSALREDPALAGWDEDHVIVVVTDIGPKPAISAWTAPVRAAEGWTGEWSRCSVPFCNGANNDHIPSTGPN